MLSIKLSFVTVLLSSLCWGNFANGSTNLGTLNATVFGTLFLSRNFSVTEVDVNWIIEAPAGLNVYLQFIEAEMLNGDFVSLYDGSDIDSSNLLKSSNELTSCPFAIISSGTIVTIRYVGLTSRSTFLVSYSVPVTSSTMLKCTNGWQTLTSPGYPSQYPSNLDVIWTLYAPVYYVIEIRWNIYLTQENQDFLTLYDGENTFIPPYVQYSGNLTSNIKTWIYTSTSNYMTLRFTSDEAVGDTGFLISYASYPSGSGPTTAPPPPSIPTTIATVAPPTDVCSSNGNYTCNCYYGFTGQHCENEINFCDELITDYTGTPVRAGQLCLHGQCLSSPVGASCKCDKGFTGQFCQDEIPNQTVIASRCALYSTNTTTQLDVPVGCPTHEICIPDNLNCAVYQACQSPLGWCIPSSSTSSYLKQIKTFMKTYEKVSYLK